MRDYVCAFGTGDILEADADCNPTTVYYSSSGTYIMELTSKTSPLMSVRVNYPVIFDIVVSSTSSSP